MKTAILSLAAAILIIPMVSAQDKAAPVSKTFKVGADTKIHVTDNPAAKLADLKVGDKVGIAYQDNNGTLVAASIHVLGEPKAGGKKGEGHKGGAKSDTELHAHGVITAVDAAAGTVTVDVQPPHHKK